MSFQYFPTCLNTFVSQAPRSCEEMALSGTALSSLLLPALKVQLDRFVDDRFGASRDDIKWVGARTGWSRHLG